MSSDLLLPSAYDNEQKKEPFVNLLCVSLVLIIIALFGLGFVVFNIYTKQNLVYSGQSSIRMDFNHHWKYVESPILNKLKEDSAELYDNFIQKMAENKMELDQALASLTTMTLPSEFITQNVPSLVDNQHHRGTCWLFSSIEVLEANYKKQGVDSGYLSPEQFVKFSVQGNGINYLRYCSENPEECPDTPERFGKDDTDGYPAWLYLFNSYLGTKLVPELETCPYIPNPGNDTVCPGMDDYLTKNPLQYIVSNLQVHYTVEDMKRALRNADVALPIVTEIVTNTHYVSCNVDGYSETDECKEKKTKCPAGYGSDYCASFRRRSTSDGMFYVKEEGLQGSGAHAMLLVGYSDSHQVTIGENTIHKGGFIVLNSWGEDNSHSKEFYAHKISKRDDQYLCPNIKSPREWVPLNHETDDLYKLRPATELTCLTPATPSLINTVVNCNSSKKYYFDHTKTYNGELTIPCFKEKDTESGEIVDVCYPPVIFDELTKVFTPNDTVINKGINDQASCGYYFLPYDYVEKVDANYGFTWVTSMDIEFSESSYEINRNKYPGFDEQYDSIKQATSSHKVIQFTDHTPWQTNVNYVPKV
eukprot:TRINITY_DN3061_c1_g1_i1.p1 TRINITY_DN3061_c1_g1~~TRINITY_DN3061_c1_g1_i1.p1  ORF type:complete len:598 (+),score=148.66 TRINITY_DN3061_c1_g1_i1:31-1794(+)